MSAVGRTSTGASGGRPRVVVLDDWEGALARLGDWSTIRERADLHIHRAPLTGRALHEALRAADVVVLNRDRTPLEAELIARLPALRYVVFTGPRNWRIDFGALAARGIAVSSTEGGPALESTCEHTWALILAWARGIGRQPGVGPLPTVLSGETLGLIGCGRIGSRVATVGRAFGMSVVTWSPGMTPERAAANGAVAVTLDALLASSLVVSLHLVTSAQTHRLMDTDRLRKMRSDALLVNTSRAELIDMDALVVALRERRIAAAALDVTPVEPLPADDPLRRVEHLTITPHAGFGSDRVFEAFARGAVEGIAAWLSGMPLPRLVDADQPQSH
jgi:phosphoglycerate dehydrogenase-like enzyme